MLYSFSSRPSLSTSSSPFSRRGINRLYSRIGLWTIIVVCVWLYIQGSTTSKGGGRKIKLVTGRRREVERSRLSFLKESHEEHLEVSSFGPFPFSTSYPDLLWCRQAFLRRVKIRPQVDKKSTSTSSSEQDVVPPLVAPPKVISSTENQPKGMGEGGVPVFKTTKASQRMALFVLWPKKGGNLDQSSL